MLDLGDSGWDFFCRALSVPAERLCGSASGRSGFGRGSPSGGAEGVGPEAVCCSWARIHMRGRGRIEELHLPSWARGGVAGVSTVF